MLRGILVLGFSGLAAVIIHILSVPTPPALRFAHKYTHIHSTLGILRGCRDLRGIQKPSLTGLLCGTQFGAFAHWKSGLYYEYQSQYQAYIHNTS